MPGENPLAAGARKTMVVGNVMPELVVPAQETRDMAAERGTGQ